jgi:hypothetical protein
MFRIYKYVGILVVVAACLFFTYHKGYKNGSNAKSVQLRQSIASLQAVISKGNTNALILANKQRDGMNKALTIRDKQYKQTKSALTIKIKQIERLKRESSNSCVNSVIPAGFK